MNTRNKNMRAEFFIDQSFQIKQAEWQTSSSSIQSAAYPCYGINVQKMPAEVLSTNAVDIETYLYGIGANNYLFPTPTPTLAPKQLPFVKFFDQTNLYMPRLPAIPQNQRP
jgi:hypothetical protein